MAVLLRSFQYRPAEVYLALKLFWIALQSEPETIMEGQMTRWKTMPGIFLWILGATTMLWSQAPQLVAVRAGRLFDSKSGQMLTNQVILVSGERITDVGPESRVKIPSGTQVIDLSQATVLPGLIDGHTHIFNAGHEAVTHILNDRHEDPKAGGAPDVNLINDTREYRAMVALASAQKDLRAGFTSLRDLMNHGNGYSDVDVRNVINKGLFMGPRMQVSTLGLVATGEGTVGSWEVNLPPAEQIADSPWKIREAVREQIHWGADWIKFHASAGHHFEPDGRLVWDGTYSLEEIQAIVDETHRRGKKAACHAYGGEGVANCVKAGADTLEHGFDLDDDAILNMIKEKGIYVEPTFLDSTMTRERDLKDTDGKFSLAAIREKTAKKIIFSGVKISFGSGVGPFPHGSQAVEFEYLVHFGMTPAQAIQTATATAAEMMGWQDRIGSLEKGKYADIIAVAGDPLKDITELQRVKFVMKGGEVVRNDMK